MGRKIKFRVPLKNGYAYVDLLDLAYGEYEMTNWPLDKADQYTGLKDMNGKEIYEGDILTGNKDVYWDNILASFQAGYTGDIRNNEVEVIGNIYENPELLTKWAKQSILELTDERLSVCDEKSSQHLTGRG